MTSTARYDPESGHDPGCDIADARAQRTGIAEPTVIEAPGTGRILIGTAGWTDPTMTAAGVFYPDGVRTPEARLRYYASRFPFVEVDAPYYALPTERNAALWAARTPPGFRFDVKAYALMTGHATETSRLPAPLRDALPPEVASKRRVYPKDLPSEVNDAVWRAFVHALQPLHRAGKLGAVLLQYPRWFVPSRAAVREILDARERLEGLSCAVELRNRRWFDGRIAGRTLDVLTEHRLPYVIVDAPQGMESSVPPILAATSPELAVIRLHGRRTDQWERPGATVVEKYRYLYDDAQLREWAPRVMEVARAVGEVHVVFNNCYGNYATTNALEMTRLLAAHARGNPDRAA